MACVFFNGERGIHTHNPRTVHLPASDAHLGIALEIGLGSERRFECSLVHLEETMDQACQDGLVCAMPVSTPEQFCMFSGCGIRGVPVAFTQFHQTSAPLCEVLELRSPFVCRMRNVFAYGD